MSKPKLTVTKDFTEQFKQVIFRFKNDDVLVGVPQEKTARTDKDTQPMNNATLMAIANFGSPANNIPPWPIMSIGIKSARDDISEQFKQAAINCLKSGVSALDTYYNRAGIIASTSIKKTINDQDGVPSGRPTQSTKDSRLSHGFKGTKYWIVTGQLRNSVTYVLRSGK